MNINLEYVKAYEFDTVRLETLVKDGHFIKEEDRYVLTDSGIKFLDKILYVAMPVMASLFFEAILDGLKNR